jgi:hypothetical protein
MMHSFSNPKANVTVVANRRMELSDSPWTTITVQGKYVGSYVSSVTIILSDGTVIRCPLITPEDTSVVPTRDT